MKKKVLVNFVNNPFKLYAFVTDIPDLEKNDLVVVDTVNGPSIAEFDSYGEDGPFEKASKWVIQKVDLTNHQKRLEQEERMKSLRKKMEDRRKALEEIQLFELLAKEDPSMKELVDEFKELSETV